MGRWTIVVLSMALALPAFAAPRRDRVTVENGALKPQDVQALGLDDMLAEGERSVQYMNQTARDVLDTLAVARKANDFARMNCIGTALTSIKGLLRISDQNSLSLRERVIGRDRAGAEHEFVKIRIARQKVTELLGRARSCGGPSGDTVFEGGAIVEKQFDDDLPQEDVRMALYQPVFSDLPPPSASPFY
jgi:hypothetical protein